MVLLMYVSFVLYSILQNEQQQKSQAYIKIVSKMKKKKKKGGKIKFAVLRINTVVGLKWSLRSTPEYPTMHRAWPSVVHCWILRRTLRRTPVVQLNLASVILSTDCHYSHQCSFGARSIDSKMQ